MRTETIPYTIGPSQTPSSIKLLIFITAAITLLCALVEPWMRSLATFTLQDILNLSWYGVTSQYFIWQPLTYLFTLPAYNGVTGILFLNLAFNLYLIWIFGSALVERFGSVSVISLYLGSGFFTGLCLLGAMSLFPTTMPVAGCTAALIALFVAWTMLNPESELLLFFIFPVKSKWLLASFLGASLLIYISQADIYGLIITIVGTLCGYFTAIFSWNLTSPFSFSHSFDQALAEAGYQVKRWFYHLLKKPDTKKIIDFQTGNLIETDDEFVDKMLAKISESGERSLTPPERKRLNLIALSKQKTRK